MSKIGTRWTTRRKLLVLLGAVVWLAPVPALADRLQLANGDSITGQLIGIADGFLTWHSDLMGDLKVDQGHVLGVESEKRVEVQVSSGTLDDCWMETRDKQQFLNCSQGVTALESWKRVVALGAPTEGFLGLKEQKGNIVVAAEDSAGNTDKEAWALEGTAEWRFDSVRHTLNFEYDNEKTNKIETKNNWEVGYAHDVFLTDQLFWTARASYEEDIIKDIDSRIELGGGVGFEFINTNFIQLSGTAGIDYVEDELVTGASRESSVIRLGVDSSWKPTTSGLELYHRSQARQSLEFGDDYQFESKTGLTYPINGHLKSQLQYKWDYKNDPAEGTEKIDSKWSMGVKYDW